MTYRTIGRLHYIVTSETRKGVEFMVDLQPQEDRKFYCSCESYLYSKGEPCKHIAFVAEAELKRMAKAKGRQKKAKR